MRAMPVLVFFVCVLATGGLPGGPSQPTLRRSIPLPGVKGRIDHFAYDPVGKRLFVAALENGSIEAIDLEKGERIQTVGGLKEPQGIVFVPSTGQVVVACGGDGTVRAYDGRTLAEKTRVEVGDDADNARLAEDGKTVLVGYGGGAIAILDAGTLRKTGEIKLSGHPEAFELEPGTTRVFVNIPGGLIGGGGDIVVADRAGQRVTATWTLRDAGRNFPMALDAPNKRLYVGSRRPACLVVIDTDSGNVVASPECVGDADEVFIEGKTGRVFVVGGDGRVDVFETGDHRAYTKAASVKTPPGSRTGLLVPERRALYVAVPEQSGEQAGVREYTLPDPLQGSER